MKDFRTLKVWEKAHAITLAVYKITEKFPKQEIYALTSQLQRAAVSIPTNIAEGQARYSAAEFHNCLGSARGSLVEVETELILAQNLEYLSQEQAQRLLGKAAELGKILNGLAGAIRPAA